MPLVGDYNLAACQVTVGSFRVTGFGASDAAKLSRMSDLGESEAAGDGAHVVFSANSDTRHELMLKLQYGTPAFRYLYELAQTQQKEAKRGAISPVAFQLYDPNDGTKIVERALRFTKLPDIAIGAKASEKEFTCLLANPDVTAGANIPLSG